MNEGIIACIPIAVLIIGALITKKLPEMLVLSSIVGAVLVYKGDFFNGYIGMAYKALSNESMQFILILLVTFGGMIALFEKSGSLQGFSNALGKFANTRKKAMVATWLMGIILFIDDYLNVLATSFSMKELTDKNRVPREHLAYGVNSMGASIAVLAPISSWAAFAMGVGAKQGVTMNVYAHAVPLMFFPIIAAIVCLLVALGIIPKIGYIKKAYKRVDDGGPLLEKEENTGVSLVNMDGEDQDEIKATTP